MLRGVDSTKQRCFRMRRIGLLPWGQRRFPVVPLAQHFMGGSDANYSGVGQSGDPHSWYMAGLSVYVSSHVPDRFVSRGVDVPQYASNRRNHAGIPHSTEGG